LTDRQTDKQTKRVMWPILRPHKNFLLPRFFIKPCQQTRGLIYSQYL